MRIFSCSQIWCKLRNISVLSILVLTIFNILFMLRILHTECNKSIKGGGIDDDTALTQKHLPPPPFPPLVADSWLPTNETTTFNIDPRLGRWDSRRLYKMIDHALVGRHFADLSSKYTICLATQGSLEKLYSLVQVAHHWSGPISAALFAAGDEEFRLLQAYTTFLRRCFAPIREKVSFHLMFPRDKLPTTIFTDNKFPSMDCTRPEVSLNEILKMRSAEITRWRVRNPYPQNHMRNLARKNCQTPNVFLTDIDIIPSVNMADLLNVFLKTESCKGLCAYVVPTYELDVRVKFPSTKPDLMRLRKKGLARPFHQKVFIYNQYATNFSRWEQDNKNKAVHISYSVTNFEFLYEPFYISSDLVPPHDERFIGYGFTRNTQVYEMYVAGYEFFVLSPVFTIHWGLQNRKGRPSWRERQNTNNRRQFDQFKREVFSRYHKDPLNMVYQTKDGLIVKL